MAFHSIYDLASYRQNGMYWHSVKQSGLEQGQNWQKEMANEMEDGLQWVLDLVEGRKRACPIGRQNVDHSLDLSILITSSVGGGRLTR